MYIFFNSGIELVKNHDQTTTLPYGKSATYLVINKIIFSKFKINIFILETRCSY